MKYSVVSCTGSLIVEERGVTDLDEIHESWLSKLGSWSEALAIYEQKLGQNPFDFDAILGCMRCLDASGEWHAVLDLVETNWTTLSGTLACARRRAYCSTFATFSLYHSQKQTKGVKILRSSSMATWQLG